MSYIEEINQNLLKMQSSVTASQNSYNKEVEVANSAFDSAKEDEYYQKLKQHYSDLNTSVGDFISSMRSLILSLPDQKSIREFSGKIDVSGAISKRGFLDYTVDLKSRCNNVIGEISKQSMPETDIKAIEKLSEYYAEICEVCSQFDKFYYKYVRTSQMEQAALDEHNEDLDKLKRDLESGLDKAYNSTLAAISKHKTTYQQITDKFLEERFSAQIGKHHAAFPTKICLGAVLHKVVDYRRDIVSKALSCGNVSELAVAFEMPLVGSFDDFD